ncbi:MAG: condensation domain-containing protein, partial [Acidobacteriota bacterium]
PARAVPLPLVDLSHLEPGEREAEAERLMASEAGSAFDLEHGPVLRAGLVRLGDSDHVVWLTIHHIATDGWSMGLLTRELSQLYAAFASHRPSPVPELAVQYADYAAWQRSWLSGDVLEAEVGYWRQQLAGAPPVMALPTDRPRSLARSSHSHTLPFELDEEASKGLAAIASQNGSTLFMVLLAGFNSLLARLSGENDVSVGSPIAGRTLLETEPLIGFFVNTLVLRGDLGGDPTFTELVQRFRRTVLEAHAHQEVPFEKLVEELEPERNLEHTPLFQVMFVLQNTPAREGEVEGLRLQPLTSTEGTFAKFDVNLGLVEHPDGVRGSLSTRQGLFDRTTAARWCAALGRLLRDASANPHHRLSELEALSPAECQQVLVQWNDSAEDYGSTSWLDELSRSVAQRPDAVAVSLDSKGLSYRELDRQAHRLAHYLRLHGAGPEIRVGVCLERSFELVIALLAVLRSGAVYVPLDPKNPPQRLAAMAADAGIGLLVTVRSLSEEATVLGMASEAALIRLDQEAAAIAACDSASQQLPVAIEHTAYVLFTSGSTGRPKGVAVSHEALGNRLSWSVSAYGLGHDE